MYASVVDHENWRRKTIVAVQPCSQHLCRPLVRTWHEAERNVIGTGKFVVADVLIRSSSFRNRSWVTMRRTMLTDCEALNNSRTHNDSSASPWTGILPPAAPRTYERCGYIIFRACKLLVHVPGPACLCLTHACAHRFTEEGPCARLVHERSGTAKAHIL